MEFVSLFWGGRDGFGKEGKGTNLELETRGTNRWLCSKG